MTRFARTTHVLETALDARAFSAVTAEVGRLHQPVWSFAAGRLSFAADADPVRDDTVFDLASLTKVVATTTLAARLVSAGVLRLDMRVASLLPMWSGSDRGAVTIRDLLEHASGLPGHRDYFARLAGRPAYERAIGIEPLEYPPHSRSLYSDLGFMLAGFIVQDRGGGPLDVQFREWRSAAGIRDALTYLPPRDWLARTAATENDPWRRRVLRGEVHDENAAALGGVAAHAGLFGTAAAVGDVARWWLARLDGEDDARTGMSAAVAASFTMRSTAPGSSRAVGWDTMLPTSSCGTRLSARAIGHTGFTGTSLWLDPALDLYAILLTNRVHPARDNDRIRQVRRQFHDAVVSDLFSSSA